MKINLQELTVTLSKNDWHYRFMKFILNEEKLNINSLCPYFWLFWLCVIISPVAVLIKSIIFLFKQIGKIIDKYWLIPRFNKWIDNVVKDPHLVYLHYYYYIEAPFTFSRIRYSSFSIMQDKLNLSYKEFSDLLEKGKEIQKKKERKKQKRLKTPIINFPDIPFKSIVKYSKPVVKFCFGLIGLTLLYWLFTSASSIDWYEIFTKMLGVLIIISAVIILMVILYGLCYLIEIIFKKLQISKYLKKFFKFIWKVVKWPFVLTWNFIKLTKDNLCPGIIWEEESK